MKFKFVAEDAYEIKDDFGGNVISLTPVEDGDGTLRITATVNGNTAERIKKALVVYDALEASFK